MGGVSWKSIIASARKRLVMRVRNDDEPDAGAEFEDFWLWEHSERVMRNAQMLCAFPEVIGSFEAPPNPDASALAGLFAAGGWIVQFDSGEVGHWKVLSRPTTDAQRESAVGILESVAGGSLSADLLETAARAIRACNDRFAQQPEAQIVAEAENLNEVGLLYILRQFRQFQAEGRPLAQLLLHWQRRVDYGYWKAHINDCLRWEVSRRVAEERLKTVGTFMDSLSKLLADEDLTLCLREAGADLTDILPRNS